VSGVGTAEWVRAVEGRHRSLRSEAAVWSLHETSTPPVRGVLPAKGPLLSGLGRPGDGPVLPRSTNGRHPRWAPFEPQPTAVRYDSLYTDPTAHAYASLPPPASATPRMPSTGVSYDGRLVEMAPERLACDAWVTCGRLLLKGAEGTSMYAYIVVALLTGARTEELRALTWDHVFLKGKPDADPPQPPHIAVWRSVRRGGDTKTRKSRRTLALPTRCVEALWQQFEDQGWDRLAAGDKWEEHGLVFSSAVGKPLDAANVRRAFRQALKGIDGINADDWTPRELRHSFVSLLSDRGVPLEVISRLVGHSGTAVTEEVYRKQIRPVIQTGAVVMDGIFSTDPQRP